MIQVANPLETETPKTPIKPRKDLVTFYESTLEVPYPAAWKISKDLNKPGTTFFFTEHQLADKTDVDNINIQAAYQKTTLQEFMEDAVNQLQKNADCQFDKKLEEIQVGKDRYKGLQIVCKYNYKPKNLNLQQCSVGIDTGCGLKFLITYTSKDMKRNFDTFMECFIKNGKYKKWTELPMDVFRSHPAFMCHVPFDFQYEGHELNPNTHFFFSPIQLLTKNAETEYFNVTFFKESEEKNAKTILEEIMKQEERLEVHEKPIPCKVNGHDAYRAKYTFYQPKKKRMMKNIVYCINHDESRYLLVNYSSTCGLLAQPLFDRFIRRFTVLH